VSKRIEVNGTELAFEDTGDEGPAVVFVHGLGGSTRVWDAPLFACEDRFRGVAYDQRGHGQSEVPEGPYAMEQFTEDLVGVLDALEIERAALVGHSFGCMVVENAALELGDRVWALAMCGGALEWLPGADEVFAQRAKLAEEGKMDEIAEQVIATGLSERCRSENAGIVKNMRELLTTTKPEGYAPASLAIADAEMRDVGKLSCPVLAFCGSEDPVTPPEEAEKIAAACPDGRTATVDGAAHWCMLEDPEGFNRVLMGFLGDSRP
jgi:3-oxoadipate enol-lactonase